MNTPPGATRWRDEPVLPDGYDDVAPLVKLARKARSRTVEFDWTFGAGDIQRLREAVFNWGSAVTGRYRCFDSRVLSAINSTLEESDTDFFLNEPKNAQDLEYEVSCVAAGESYRLVGHAPFDVVFAYGMSAVIDRPETRVRLGEVVRMMLASAVGQLGWDLHRLAEKRLQPVRNALYGLALNYGIEADSKASEAATSLEPSMDAEVRFQGPFTAFEEKDHRCLFSDNVATQGGVYLWTIDVGGETCPWYVGQTRRGFGQRMGEHLASYLSGQYSTYDPVALTEGRNSVLWRADSGARWPGTLPSFLDDYAARTPNLLRMLKLLRFHVAPLDGDAHLHNRVEGAIGRHFRDHVDPRLRGFFAPGIRLPAAIPYDKPLRLVLSSDITIAGLPEHLQA